MTRARARVLVAKHVTAEARPDLQATARAIGQQFRIIDVQLPEAKGRPWSKVPVEAGWERVISGNSCPKGLVEDVNEMRVVKARLEEAKRAASRSDVVPTMVSPPKADHP